jgi:hypothetical protein
MCEARRTFTAQPTDRVAYQGRMKSLYPLHLTTRRRLRPLELRKKRSPAGIEVPPAVATAGCGASS